MAEFDFVEVYRQLQPLADRETINARIDAFNRLKALLDEDDDKVVDLAHFAYSIPRDPNSEAEAWLLEALRAGDQTFSIQRDSEEAARLATLTLHERVLNGLYHTCVVVLAASFAGKRKSADHDALSVAALKALHDMVRTRGEPSSATSVSIGKSVNVADLVKKYSADEQEAVSPVLDAITKDYLSQIRQVALSANAAINLLVNENRRLAEEIDILWWHEGKHSFLLDGPLSNIPTGMLPVVIGADIATLVNSSPGPYGVYGILRRALGDGADNAIRLGDVFALLTDDYDELIENDCNGSGIAPVHGVLCDHFIRNTPVSPESFHRRYGLTLDVTLTAYELAVQSYHEALLLNKGWIR